MEKAIKLVANTLTIIAQIATVLIVCHLAYWPVAAHKCGVRWPGYQTDYHPIGVCRVLDQNGAAIPEDLLLVELLDRASKKLSPPVVPNRPSSLGGII